MTQKVLDLHQFGPKVVNTDMPGREFDAAWKGIGRYARLVLWILVPFYVIWFFLFGTKAFLARSLETDDLPSRQEVLGYGDEFERFQDLVLTERDKLLVQEIHAITTFITQSRRWWQSCTAPATCERC